jgi:hypothetical protein
MGDSFVGMLALCDHPYTSFGVASPTKPKRGKQIIHVTKSRKDVRYRVTYFTYRASRTVDLVFD